MWVILAAFGLLAFGPFLKVLFTAVAETPTRVTSADVMGFISQQRNGSDGSNVVPIDRSAGLSPRTIRRRLSSVSGFCPYLMVRDDTSISRNPVPRGLVTRRERSGPKRRALLVRTPVMPQDFVARRG
ncbi:MAG: integrase/recombinase XerD [Candidatus Poriferisodalaceae bacterium]|jgi:integrase/recombinase XerD